MSARPNSIWIVNASMKKQSMFALLALSALTLGSFVQIASAVVPGPTPLNGIGTNINTTNATNATNGTITPFGTGAKGAGTFGPVAPSVTTGANGTNGSTFPGVLSGVNNTNTTSTNSTGIGGTLTNSSGVNNTNTTSTNSTGIGGTLTNSSNTTSTNGTNGNNGTNGFNGTNSTNGINGNNGNNGLNGQNGNNGNNGLNGQNNGKTIVSQNEESTEPKTTTENEQNEIVTQGGVLTSSLVFANGTLNCQAIASQLNGIALPNGNVCNVMVTRHNSQALGLNGNSLNNFILTNSLLEFVPISSSQVFAIGNFALLPNEVNNVLATLNNFGWSVTGVHPNTFNQTPNTPMMNWEVQGDINSIVSQANEAFTKTTIKG